MKHIPWLSKNFKPAFCKNISTMIFKNVVRLVDSIFRELGRFIFSSKTRKIVVRALPVVEVRRYGAFPAVENLGPQNFLAATWILLIFFFCPYLSLNEKPSPRFCNYLAMFSVTSGSNQNAIHPCRADLPEWPKRTERVPMFWSPQLWAFRNFWNEKNHFNFSHVCTGFLRHFGRRSLNRLPVMIKKF